MIRPSSGDAAARVGRPSRDAFGFDLDEDAWLAQLRALGSDTSIGRLGVLGGYELLEAVGRGGQGIVYKARQPNTGRLVALKRLSAGIFATPEMRARFEREVEAAAALDHPHIVTVYGSETFDGQPVLAMQWIDGVPFDQWSGDCGSRNAEFSRDAKGSASSQRRGVREVLETFVLVCDAIQHAHQRGVIHRDIKPSNILVDKDNRPHVLDFGLAKLSADSSRDAGLTETGAFVGTPAYAAPEQLAGSSKSIDVRTDVYSLGVVLHQALSGALPEDLPEQRHAALSRKGHVPPPTPNQLRPRIGDEVETIVLKCLAAEPDRRYQGVGDLGRDIRYYVRGEPIEAKRDSLAYVLRKQLSRYRLAATVASAFIIVVVIALIATLNYWKRASESAALAQKESKKYVAINRFTTDELLGAIDPDKPVHANLTVREALDRTLQQLNRGALATEPAVELEMRRTVGVLYRKLGEYQLAEENLERTVDLRRKSTEPGQPLQLAGELNSLGVSLMENGKFEKAESVLNEAIEIGHRERSETDSRVMSARRSLVSLRKNQRKYAEAEALGRELVECRNRGDPEQKREYARDVLELASVLREAGKFAEAETRCRAAISIQKGLTQAGRSDDAECLHVLGVIQRQRGQFAESEKTLRECHELQCRLLGEEHPATVTTLSDLATTLQNAGKFGDAETLTRRSLELRKQRLDPRHPAIATSLSSFGSLLHSMGKLEESERTLREALDIRRNAAGVEPSDLAVTLNNLASLLKDRDRKAEAEALFRESLEIRRRDSAAPRTVVATALNNLANLLREEGKFVEAEPLLLEALEIRRAELGDQHLDVATCLNNLALLRKWQQRWDEAAALYAEAIDIRRRLLPSNHPQLANTLYNLGVLKKTRGESVDAEPLFRECLEIQRVALPKDHPQTASTLTSLGSTLIALRRAEEAEPLHREALRICKARYAAGHLQIAKAQMNLGVTMLHQQQLEEADTLFSEAWPVVSRNERVVRDYCPSIERIVVEFNALHAAEPNRGFDNRAGEWRSRLDDFAASSKTALSPSDTP